MAIPVTCLGCKRAMQVKDDFAGRRALCPFCKAEVQVPDASHSNEPDRNEYALLPDAPANRDSRDDKHRRARLSRDDEPEERTPAVVVSGNVVTGGLMMLGAVVWFFGAMALGWVFFYPPILFIIGLITFIRGLAGSED